MSKVNLFIVGVQENIIVTRGEHHDSPKMTATYSIWALPCCRSCTQFPNRIHLRVDTIILIIWDQF